MSKELTEFLGDEGGPIDAGSSAGGGDSGAAGAAAAPATSVSAPSNEAEKSDTAGAAPAAPAAPAPKADDPPEDIPEDVRGLRSALVAERGLRKDHKGRADRTEGELLATKAQLEALLAEKAKPAVVPAAAPAARAVPGLVPGPPNVLEDPVGYHQYWETRALNDRLNNTEEALRDQKGDADVDAKVAVFEKAVAANPSLIAEMHRQRNPYRWMYAQAEKMIALAEVGDDPAAWRKKVEAEVRAQVEKEIAEGGAAPAAAGAAVVDLPRSLASVRSAAPRTMAVEEAPEFEDVFKRRKRT